MPFQAVDGGLERGNVRRWALGPGQPLYPLRPLRTRHTSCPRVPLDPLNPLRPRGSSRSLQSRRPPRPRIPLRSLRSDRSRGTRRSLRTDRTCQTVGDVDHVGQVGGNPRFLGRQAHDQAIVGGQRKAIRECSRERDRNQLFGGSTGNECLSGWLGGKRQFADLRAVFKGLDRPGQRVHLQRSRLGRGPHEHVQMHLCRGGVRGPVELEPSRGGLASAGHEQVLVGPGPGHQARRSVADHAQRLVDVFCPKGAGHEREPSEKAKGGFHGTLLGRVGIGSAKGGEGLNDAPLSEGRRCQVPALGKACDVDGT